MFDRALSRQLGRASFLVGVTLFIWLQAEASSSADPAWFQDALDWHLNAANVPRDVEATAPERPVVIAVVDDGVRLSHRDLRGFIWRNPKEIPFNDIDDDANGYADDVHGWDLGDEDETAVPPEARAREFYHGTHLAGVIARVARRAYGDRAADFIRIMPVKVLSDQAMQTNMKHGYRGIDYAIRSGADIIVAAWNNGLISTDESRILRLARAKGALVVASAGNFPDGREQFPAAKPSVLAVTALGRGDVKGERSNFGSFIDLSAPGIGIVGASAEADTHYETRSGSSQATALVAAAAAIVKLRHPAYSWREVTACLKQSADLIEEENPRFVAALGAGKLNLGAALACPVLSKAVAHRGPDPHPQGYMYFDSRHGDAASWTVTPRGRLHGVRFWPRLIEGEAPEGTVEFFAGTSARGRPIASYPLTDLPNEVFVAGTAAHVVFSREESEHPLRWLLEYKAEPVDLRKLYCQDTKHLTVEGSFDDGSGPNDYSYHSSCKWLITAPRGKVIELDFTEFETESDVDKVYLFDSTETHQRQILAIFSGNGIPRRVTTPRDRLLVWFVTDGEIQKAGWRAEFRFVDP